MGIIYSCRNNVTNKIYIGMSIRTLSARKQEHLKELRNGIKKGIWQQEFDMYGESAFEFSILEETENVYLPIVELEYINKFNTIEPNGYNRKLSCRAQFYPEDLASASRHDIESLLKALSLGVYTQESIPNISKLTELSIGTVSDLLRCKSYKWIKHYDEETYIMLENILTSGIRRSSLSLLPKLTTAIDIILTEPYNIRLVAEKSGLRVPQVESLLRRRSYLWLEKVLPDKYAKVVEFYNNRKMHKSTAKSLIDLDTGDIYTGTSIQELANILNIDHRRVSDLISGKLEVYQNKYMLCT